MNNKSAKALAWAAGILIAVAPAIISPPGTFSLLVLAILCAAIPSVFASKRCRIISIVLLIASITLAISYYPASERELEAYMQRAKKRATHPQVTTPTDQVVITR
ncbi:MAG: hypothetical protein HYS23_11910 [Geobacter sp.]|nr:hypothetical protein [Geobacter sp.]